MEEYKLSEHIVLTKNNHIGVVDLNRTPMNIFNVPFYTEVKEAFEKINTMDDIFVIVVRSLQKNFSFGGDMSEIRNISEENANRLYKAVAACMNAVYTCQKPTIAVAHGKVIGAGLAFCACCDMIIAGESASFSLPEIKVGFIGAAEFLELIVPRKAARYYAYTGKPIPKEKLLAWGGIYMIVKDEALLDTALSVANELLESAPNALYCFKESMNINDDERLSQKYFTAASYVLGNSETEDFKECHRAWAEKRKPVYTGK